MITRLFVWLEWGIISLIVHHTFIVPIKITKFQKSLLLICCFCLTANLFLLMPWYTTDAVLMSTIGIYFLFEKKNETLAFFFLGLSVLCKQNFILLMVIFFLRKYRKINNWIFFCIPGSVYFIFLCLSGALVDAINDFTTFKGFVEIGILPFITHKSFLRGIILCSASDIVKFFDKKNKFKIYPFISPLLLSALYTSLLAIQGHPYKIAIYFLGCTLYFVIKNKFKDEKLLIVFLICWISGISIGHNAPLICLGALFCIMCSQSNEQLKNKYIIYAITILCCTFLINARLNWIHGEQSASKLTYPLVNILPGGKGIYTFRESADSLKEINNLFKKYSKNLKVIIPDYPGFWPGATQPNPLPTDWASHLEIPNDAYMVKYINQLKALKSESIILVAKYEAWSFLADHLTPRRSTQYLQYIEKHFKKIEELKYFDVYIISKQSIN